MTNNSATYTDSQWNVIYSAVKASGVERYLDLLLSSEGNAQDTVYGDKEATVEEYNEIRFVSLMMLLGEEDKATRDFFASIGVRA